MQKEIKRIFEDLKVSVTVLSGGSVSIGAESTYSDREFYIVSKSFLGLYKIINSKSYIHMQKKKYAIEADLLLTTEWLVKKKFFYILGVDESGVELSYAYDKKMMRNTSIKMGLRAFLDSQREKDPLRKQYLLSKAAIQLVYAYCLCNNRPIKGQLFTPHGATALVEELPTGAKKMMKECIALKFSEARIDTRAYEAVLRWMIESVIAAFRIHPWSLRAYLWQLLFALRYVKVGEIIQYKDRRIINKLFEMTHSHNLQGYDDIRPEILQTLVI